MYFQKRIGIHDGVDYFAHVVGLVRVVGNNGVQRGSGFSFHSRRCIISQHGRLVFAVLRNIAQQLFNMLNTSQFVGAGKVRHARFSAVGAGPAQFFGGHFFMRHGLHHVGAGHKHVARVFHHENKIRDGRTIHGPTRTRPHNGRELRNHARRAGVAVENIGVPRQREHTFLNTRPPRIVEANERRTVLHGQVHELADLFGVGFGQGTAKDRKILCEDVH